MAVAELAVNLVANSGDFVKNMNKVSRKVDQTGRQLKGAGEAIMGLTAPLVLAGGVAIKMSADFNKSMSAVEVMISRVETKGGKSIDQLKKSVIDLSNQTGISSKEMAEGLFLVISTFGNTADATKQLEVASKAALAGGATVSETIALLGVVSKNFGDTSAEAQQKIIDLAFVTNELGVTNFQELASSMTMVTPIAASMGVSVEELFATYSALTGVTGNTSEVTTQFAAAIGALQKPTADMTKIFQALGVETGEELIRQEGLLGTFQLVEQEQQKLGVTMAAVMGRKEGLNFVTGLLTSQTEKYTQALEANANSAGTGEKAYETFTEGVNKTGFTINKLMTIVSNMMSQFGDELAPVLLDFVENGLVPVLNSLQGLLKWFQALEPSTKKWIVQMTAGTAALGGILFVAGKFISALSELWKLKVIIIPVVNTLAVVIGALLTPIGLVVAAIAGLAAGIVIFWDEIKVAIGWVKKFSLELSQKLTKSAKEAIASVKKMMSGIWDTISKGFKRVINFVGDATGKVTGFFNDMYMKVVGGSIVPDMVTEVMGEFDRMGDAIITGADGSTKGVVSKFDGMASGINNALSEVLGDSSQFVNSIATIFNAQGVGGIVSDIFNSEGGVMEGLQGALSGAFSGGGGIGAAIGATIKGAEDAFSVFDSFLDGDISEGGLISGLLGGGSDAKDVGIAEALKARIEKPLTLVTDGMINQVGGVNASLISLGKNLDDFGKSAEATTSTLFSMAGAATGGIVGEQLGGMLGDTFVGEEFSRLISSSFSTNPGTLARRQFERGMNQLLADADIKIFNEDGMLEQLDNFSVGAKDRFNKPWGEAFFDLTGDASGAFQAVGTALHGMLGISEDIAGQMSVLLTDNIGGNIRNLALLVDGLGLKFEDVEAALVQAWQNGEISALEFGTQMHGLRMTFDEVEAATKDIGMAIDLVMGSDGTGVEAVQAFTTLASAATKNGIDSVEDFVAEAIKQGKFTSEQGQLFIQTMAANNISSMGQLADASRSTLIEILGSFQALEEDGSGSFFGLVDSAKDSVARIEKSWQKLQEMKDVELRVNVKVTGDELPDPVQRQVTQETKRSKEIVIPELDTGGIVTSPTLALIGENRKEAVIPLQELPDMMKNVFDSAGSGGVDMARTVFNIDARGAMRGVGDEIKRALRDFTDTRNGLLGTT